MPLRVGFLGIAHMHAWGYVTALRSCQDARVTAVWDPETPRKDAFALENGIHQAESVEDLFDRVDAVVITSPNKSHVEHASLAAKAGKAMLCRFFSAAMRRQCAVELRSAAAVVRPPSCMLAA